MTLSCADVRARFEDYLEETLEPQDRRLVRAHLAGCGPCREEAAFSDPALLFAAVPPEEVSSQDVEWVLSAVSTAIALKKTERKLQPPRGGRRVGALAAAAAVIALLLVMPGSPARRPEPRLAGEARKVSAGNRGTFVPVAQPAANQKFPGNATIYDWNPGGGEPRVVWIVDRSLDI